MAHAIVLTLVRLAVTQRRLLEWETAAASAVRGRGPRRTGARGCSWRRWSRARPSPSLGLVARRWPLRPQRAPGRAAGARSCGRRRPLVAYVLSRPVPRTAARADGRGPPVPAPVARKTWRYFETFVGAEDHGLPPDNFQEVPDPRVAHRTSPTNIGMGLLATLAAHDLGFIEHGRAGGEDRGGPDHHGGARALRGPLLNWYDTQTPGPAPARLRLHRGQRQPRRGALMALAEGLRAGGPRRPRRAAPAAFADGMSFRFLYDPQRRIFSIGYRLADAEGPGRLDPSYYDLLASEARLASFIAIAKGDVPETHWFHLGRLVTSVHGTPTLLSWSATLFEYLMPLLVMRSYPDTLLDQTCRMAVRRQIEYGAERGVPWGISESAYNVVDRHDNYQYKAFGVPGLGLKRGLGDELVVAPYATALAAMVDPRRRRGTCGAWPPRGSTARTATTRPSTTPTRETDEAADARRSRRPPGTVVRAYMAHHQGMTLVVAGQRAPRATAMVERFHADPRVQATELLLQERVPAPGAHHPAAPGGGDARRAAPRPRSRVRRFRSPHTRVPPRAVPVQRQLHRGGHQRRRGRQLLPRPRGDAAPRGPDPRPGQPVPLPARRAQRRRVVGHLPPDGAGRRRSTWSRSCAGEGDLPPRATTASPPSSTSRSPPRTTSRCAGWR